MRGLVVLLTLMLAAPVAVTRADARAGGGFSFGSRGARTFSAPPPTMTAPRPAFPMQRTEMPRLGTPGSGYAGSTFARPRFGFGSGLAAGLLGAGLFGLLSGNGFFGGLGGGMSLFGLLIQIALIGLVVRMALNYLRRGNAAYAGGPNLRSGLGSDGVRDRASSGTRDAIPIMQPDYAAFERSLSDIQYAYGREDMNALARMTTPEMLRELGSEIDANRRRNLRNDMAEVRLLQGDVAESWREGPVDYATVAMRFAGRDTMVDRSTGRLMSGDPVRPVETTELWTFRRDNAGPWRLSAIQQTS